MPPVQHLRGNDPSASFGPALGKGGQLKVAADLEQDRRALSGTALAQQPLVFDERTIGQPYSPPAVTLLLTLETIAIFVIGRAAAVLWGIGIGESEFGVHALLLAMAAFAFPVATFLQHSFDKRPRTVAAIWGMRLLAPLAVALLVAIALFTSLFPTTPLANSEAALLHWVGSWFIASYLAGGFIGVGFEGHFRRRERSGKLARHVAVYGGGVHGQRFIEALTHLPHGCLRVEAFFDDRTNSIPELIADVPFGGTTEEMITFVQEKAIDEIFVALPWSADNRILGILRKLRSLPVPVRLAPDTALLYASLPEREASEMVLAPVIRRQPLSPWGLFAKDVLDRILAALALLWFAPLFTGIAIAVKLSSPGPVFFRQQRLGFNNRPFSVYKFRSMRVAAAPSHTLKQATRGDARVTRVGAFLRRWSLDELPQLLNVLRGDMSLVGPRPHPMWRQAADLWEQGGSEPLDAIIHEYAARHRVKPGITGWAQISGFRGETATVDRMRRRVELDIYYIDHWSLWFDFRIILATFLTLFKTDEAY